jgi:hypothetical protein
MGEVLYRWLTVKRQEIVPGAFLFLNRYRTGLKTGGQLPGLVFPDSCCKSGFRFEKKPAGLSNQKHQQLVEIKRNANAGIILFCQVVSVKSGTETKDNK